jgi:hypothetical protein
MVTALKMACLSSVFSIDFDGKRVLSIVNVNESFVDVTQKLTNDVGGTGHCVHCSTNASEWTLLTADILALPVIQVMHSFGFKYIRIDKKPSEPDPEPVHPDQAKVVKNTFQLMMTHRKRRLPEKKIGRLAICG